MELKNDERIDDLHRKGYKIIQNTQKFCFGIDAVLLTGFSGVKDKENVLDLGTGTGIIPILLEAKTKGSHFTGLEIQEESVEMAVRSVELNCLEDKISIIQGDIKEAVKLFPLSSFDVITSNPPYMNNNNGIKNNLQPKSIARHEILCTLEDVIKNAASLLKVGGRFYMVHRPSRLPEIIVTLKKYKLEPKRLRFVHPYINKEPNMILIESVRHGKPLLKVEPPLIVYKSVGEYTDEIYEIYGYNR
ncbi:methyltransferase [Vallitalea longa]|uniref:Methyltransferase n=1 Tax=Vallitalea longa TaxID=2936439 RepID=A0A9W5YE15_9FIRM|nr:tRNA1(Val) (adenine(37)-N6)-methyltransferase [Vallitalea longa]GKX32227.1 methyltransferase [Vallitalea longa]